MSLKEIDLFSCSIQKSKFLKSKDKIIYCGNQLNNISQLSIIRCIDNIATIESSVNYMGNCNDLSICETRNEIIIASNQNNINNINNLVLYKLRNDINNYYELINISEELENILDKKILMSNISSIAFDEYNNILTHSKDNGTIILNDLITGKLLYNFNINNDIINNICYKHANTLIVSTHSPQYRVKIFDLRSHKPDILILNDLNNNNNNFNKYKHIYTAITPHKLNETLACGTIGGDLILWDLRNTGKILSSQFNIHNDKSIKFFFSFFSFYYYFFFNIFTYFI